MLQLSRATAEETIQPEAGYTAHRRFVRDYVLSFVTAGVIIGFVFGPVGAVVGGLLGLEIGITAGVAGTIVDSANKWLNQRLVCLGNPSICAVGTITFGPRHSELGVLDNDEFFDLLLMPHRTQDDYVEMLNTGSVDPPNAVPPPRMQPPRWAELLVDASKGIDENQHIRDNPKNEIYEDGLQGQMLLRPNPNMLLRGLELGYLDQGQPDWKQEHRTRSRLHVEAEGDFWVRMKDSAAALGAMAAVAVLATAAGAAAGAYAGSAAGCALGTWFFGPVGCAIGAFLGGLLGGLAGGGAAGGGSYLAIKAVMQAMFDEDPGEVDDANVGDLPPGGYQANQHVVVLGEHVYDGLHDGWHELHPLIAIKIVSDESGFLTWDPAFAETPSPGLTVEDMKRGMSSPTFAAKAAAYVEQECRGLREAHAPETGQEQQKLVHRWSIHPAVDGCQPEDSGNGNGPH